MSYVKLAAIKDNAEFIAAAKSMGWDETNYQGILEDIGDCNNSYIVNFDLTQTRMVGVEVIEDVEILCTIGDECGNRWYNVNCTAYKDKEGYFWVDGVKAISF